MQNKCSIPASEECKKHSTDQATDLNSKFFSFTILVAIPFAIITAKLAETKYINQFFAAQSFVIFVIGGALVWYYDKLEETGT